MAALEAIASIVPAAKFTVAAIALEGQFSRSPQRRWRAIMTTVLPA